jgi:hypothetical protein
MAPPTPRRVYGDPAPKRCLIQQCLTTQGTISRIFTKFDEVSQVEEEMASVTLSDLRNVKIELLLEEARQYLITPPSVPKQRRKAGGVLTSHWATRLHPCR